MKYIGDIFIQFSNIDYQLKTLDTSISNYDVACMTLRSLESKDHIHTRGQRFNLITTRGVDWPTCDLW